jgi:PleD family two-component response regulator
VVIWIARRFYRLSSRLRQQLDENRRLQDELRALTITDPLTSLHNRRHFDVVCAAEWERARRDRRPLAVLFIDVDHFKAYNDCHGHRAGDACLAAVARAIRQSLQRPATLPPAMAETNSSSSCRIPTRTARSMSPGACWPPSARSTSATTTCRRARHAEHRGGAARAGPTTHPGLLERADRALYAAKSAGRGRIMAAPA